MGVFSGGMRIGSLVGVLLGGILFDALGRSTSFLIIAAIGLLGIPAFLDLIRRSSSGIVASTSIQADATQTKEPPYPRSLGRKFQDFLAPSMPEMEAGNRYKLLAANFTTFSFYLVMSGILVSTLGFYLRERVGDEVTVAGLVLGIATLNGLLLASRWISDVTAPYLGHLGDRFGHERIPIMAIPICMAALLLLGFNTPVWLDVRLAATGLSRRDGFRHLLERRGGWNGAGRPQASGYEPVRHMAGRGPRLGAPTGLRRPWLSVPHRCVRNWRLFPVGRAGDSFGLLPSPTFRSEDSEGMNKLPTPLPCALEGIGKFKRRLVGRTAVVFLDYDGTLTPIVSRPELAQIAPEMKALVSELADRCSVAIVSGRSRATLWGFLGLENVIYAGGHGMDIAGQPGTGLRLDAGREFREVMETYTGSFRRPFRPFRGRWWS